MSTIRVHKTSRYFSLSNEPINDERLSWDALGLLTYLLSKPNDWEIRAEHLIALKRGAGKNKIYNLLKELEQVGYLARRREHKGDGTFDWVRDLYESPDLNPYLSPSPENGEMVSPPFPYLPDMAEPDMAEPDMVNGELYIKTERQSTEEQKTDPPSTQQQQTPDASAGTPEVEPEKPPDVVVVDPPVLSADFSQAFQKAGILGKTRLEILRQQPQTTPDDIRAMAAYRAHTNATNPQKIGTGLIVEMLKRGDRAPSECYDTHYTNDDEGDGEELPPPLPRPAKQPPTEAERLWADVQTTLSLSLHRPVYDNVIRLAAAQSLDADGITIIADNAHAADVMATRMRAMIEERLHQSAGRPLAFRVHIPTPAA